MRIHGATHARRAPGHGATHAGNDRNGTDPTDGIDPADNIGGNEADPFGDGAIGAGKRPHKPKEPKEPKPHRLGRGATFTQDKDGSVTIDAASPNDRINVERDRAGRIVVEVNGAKHRFAAKKIASLTINGSSGGDTIRIAKGIDIPITVNETRGASFIKNEADRATINVGSGSFVSNLGDSVTVDGGAGGSRIVNRSNGTTIRSQGPISLDSQGALNRLEADVFERGAGATAGMLTGVAAGAGRTDQARRAAILRAGANGLNQTWSSVGVLQADAVREAFGD